MASSSTIVQIPHDSELREIEHTPVTQRPVPVPRNPNNAVMIPRLTQTPTVVDNTLASVASLTQLLPTGPVSFIHEPRQVLCVEQVCDDAPAFLCGLSCVFFTFTDSLVGTDGKVYYGITTLKGFFVFNFKGDNDNRPVIFPHLEKYRIRFVDYIHAIFTMLVFLAVSFSDVSVQECFFPHAGNNTKELLVNLPLGRSVSSHMPATTKELLINLPLGAGFLASMVFIVFPTTRKGIGYTNPTASRTF